MARGVLLARQLLRSRSPIPLRGLSRSPVCHVSPVSVLTEPATARPAEGGPTLLGGLPPNAAEARQTLLLSKHA